jgi:BirA family biotin operon repressor/biotin-[acetyl-CoA-carboxylase] ligase
VGLKWPNDILLTASGHENRDKNAGVGAGGKVCGLLVESVLNANSGGMDHAVLGIGINVNQHGDELPPVPDHRPQPTSLARFLGRPVNRTDLLVAVCGALTKWLATSPPSTPEVIHAAWQDRLLTLGQTVTANPAGAQPFTGTAIATTLTGDLVLRNPAGEARRFSAGDVSTGPRS